MCPQRARRDNLLIVKKLLLGLWLGLACLRAGAGDATWLTDIKPALATAKTEKKMLLLDITGSDWCEYCIRLRKLVFEQPEFIEYAKKNLVLVEADFPKRKKQTRPERKAAEAARDKYAPKFEMYPTVVVLNSEGKRIGELAGYYGETPKEYIAKLEKFRQP